MGIKGLMKLISEHAPGATALAALLSSLPVSAVAADRGRQSLFFFIFRVPAPVLPRDDRRDQGARTEGILWPQGGDRRLNESLPVSGRSKRMRARMRARIYTYIHTRASLVVGSAPTACRHAATELVCGCRGRVLPGDRLRCAADPMGSS
jgi:hypothetical protein